MTTPQIIATALAVLFIIAMIVAVIVLWSANDDWNAEGYEMDENTRGEIADRAWVAYSKMSQNDSMLKKARQWPDWRTADPDKAIEHDRTGD